jgi:4'-phosphopantetheinyl transferase
MFDIPTLQQQSQLWLANIQQLDDADCALLDSALSTDERAALAQAKTAKQRQRQRLSRSLSRLILAKHSGCSPQQLAFSYNPQGKPLLANNPALAFNLSHSGDWVVLAVAQGCEQLGVDVEHCQRRNKVLAIAERYFAASELAELQALPAEQQRRRFFDYWTLKEAYIKARGEGLAMSLQSFAFELTAQAITLKLPTTSTDNAAQWQFYQQTLGTDYVLALAAKNLSTPLAPLRLQPFAKVHS